METSNKPQVNDIVGHPRHYAGNGVVECKDAMDSMAYGYDLAEVPANVSYWCLTALKYLWRAPLKNGKTDLRKARRCMDFAIKAVEGD